MPAGCGPYRVITHLGVYGFDDDSKRMMLVARHPGVTLEEIQDNSEFPILLPGTVAESAPPTAAEQRALREIDPTGMVLGKST